MKLIPIYDDTKPIACTIHRAEVPARVELIDRMRSNLTAIERTEHGMLLRFPNASDIEADLQRFAVEEKRCCEFWGFAIAADGGDLTLRWDAPPDAEALVDQLLGYFNGHAESTSIAGLL